MAGPHHHRHHSSPTPKSHDVLDLEQCEESTLLHAYMVLHSQEAHMKRRLSVDSNPSQDSRGSSLSSSPTRCVIEAIPEESTKDNFAAVDGPKSVDLSSQIKSTLTDLLNCAAVKGDTRMRNWVATQLMDAERQHKHHKRTRNAIDAHHQVGTIAASLR